MWTYDTFISVMRIMGIILWTIMGAIEGYEISARGNRKSSLIDTILNMSGYAFCGAIIGAIIGVPFVYTLPIVIPVLLYKKYYGE